MTPEQKTVDKNLHELAELRSKVEEDRNWMNKETWNWSFIRETFDRFFPPPKKGCWGFWRDRNDYVRYFEGHPTKESAESGRAHLEVAGCNPSPVFFLPEEK